MVSLYAQHDVESLVGMSFLMGVVCTVSARVVADGLAWLVRHALDRRERRTGAES